MATSRSRRPAAARALTAADLQGAWAGSVVFRGETTPFALELGPEEDGKVLVQVSIPAIHLHRVALGRLPVAVTGEEVRLGSWILTCDRAGGTLRGTVPESLAPVYELPFTLHRVAALDPPQRREISAPVAAPVWTFDAGSPLWAGLTVADGLVLAGAEDGRLHALDARTGKRRWEYRAGGAIRTRATVVDGVAMLQADDGVLYGLSAATGEELWRLRVADRPADRRPFSDPTSRYDRFGSDVVHVAGRLVLGTHEGRVLCLDAATRAILWEFRSGDAVVAAPSVAGDRVVFGSFDGHVYALDAETGRLDWKHDTGKPVVSTPAVAGRLVIVGSRSYDLVALDATTGALAWRRYIWFSWVESSPVVRDGTVYVGSSDAAAVFAFDAATGTERWKADVWGWAWGEPLVTAERVVVGTAGQRGYPAPHRGAVVALDRATGRPAWQFTVEPSDEATFGFTGSPAATGGRVFVAALDGRVYAFAE